MVKVILHWETEIENIGQGEEEIIEEANELYDIEKEDVHFKIIKKLKKNKKIKVEVLSNIGRFKKGDITESYPNYIIDCMVLDGYLKKL